MHMVIIYIYDLHHGEEVGEKEKIVIYILIPISHYMLVPYTFTPLM